MAETLDLTGESSQGGLAATPTPQLFVLFARDALARPGSRHLLRGVDAVHLGRGDVAESRRTRRDGQAVLDVRLADGRVSSTHARIVRGARDWVVEDAGSRNGVVVDGQAVERARLVDGSVIEIGGTFLLYRDAVAVGPTAAADLQTTELKPFSPLWRTLHAPLDRQYQALARLAPTALSVLVHGETGAGKERIAAGLHALSRRAGPLVPVNCATLDPTLADSTLFGHKRGAFTGAAEARSGLFRSADGGTLFLDEVGELPPPVQARLLRVLETGELTPVGSDQAVRVDVRVVAATLRPLAEVLRADLLARLAQVTVEVPPLRARREDLGLLLADLLPSPAPTLSRELAWALLRAAWPHNIRQLAHVLKVAATLADGALTVEHLPPDLLATAPTAAAPSEADPRQAAFAEALRAHGGNVSEVARALGLSRNAVHRWIKRFGLDPEAYRGGGST